MPKDTRQNRRSKGSSPSFLNLDLRYFAIPGLILLVFFAPLMRGLFFPGDLYPFLTVFGVVLVLGVLDAVLRRRPVWGGLMHWAVLWLALSYGISCFWAASPPAAVKGFLTYAMYFGVFWLSWHFAGDRKGREVLTVTLFLSGTAVALVGLLSATRIFEFPGAVNGARIMSTLQYPNALAAYMMFTSIVGLTLLILEDNAALRLLYGAGTFLQTMVFLSSYSRGGWVIYPVAVLIMGLGLPSGYRSRLLFSVSGTLTAVLLTTRQFTNVLESKTPEGSVKYVLLGLGIALTFEVVYQAFKKVSDQLAMSPARKVITYAAGAYAVFTFAVYGVMLIGQFNAGLGGVLPASILRRLSTISMDDPSLLTRAFATRDAVDAFTRSPIFGGGAGAWNAWYHQIQRVLYWTTEVHNHFAQVLVETGIFGFAAYLMCWASLICVSFRSVAAYWVRSRLGAVDESEGGEDRSGAREAVRVWGLLSACLSIGAHSAMDFELSLPGVTLQLFALFGILWSIAGRGLSRRVQVGTGKYAHQGGAGNRTGEGVEAALNKVKVSERFCTIALTVLILALGTTVSAGGYAMNTGARYGALAAVHLMRQDYITALGLYEQARRFDPFTASYSLDMAQAYAAMALLGDRPEVKERALLALKEAREKEPLNIAHRFKETEVLTGLGEVQEAAEAARMLTELLPLDMKVYEVYAKSNIIAFLAEAKGGTGSGVGENQSSYSDGDASYIDNVLSILDILQRQREKVTGRYQERWSPSNLEPSAELKLYLGQAYYLRADLSRAVECFEEARKKQSCRTEAELWLAASRVLRGEKVVVADEEALQKVISFYGASSR